MADQLHLSAAEGRAFLLSHLRLTRPFGRGPRAVRRLLDHLGAIQLDPLDVIGTNADLVALARVDGIERGDVFRAVYPGHAFEHFAKERCLLPARAFPWYRDSIRQTSWWRHDERQQRLPENVVRDVLAEIADRGPVTAADLEHRGSVDPIDWAGWRGTARASSMAVEVLWTRCDIVVCGRTESGAKLYDIAERALPPSVGAPALGRAPEAGAPTLDFDTWAVLERVNSAGLIASGGGPAWSTTLSAARPRVLSRLLEEKRIVEVTIEGGRRKYCAPPEILRRRRASSDGRMRILGPLDPLLWDRALIKQLFGFEYVWEVYKPAEQRRWGWYVCPLLHEGRLVGRIEARVDGKLLRVDRVWVEGGAELDRAALRECLERHARACGCEGVRGTS
jgi:hypothetical protein